MVSLQIKNALQRVKSQIKSYEKKRPRLFLEIGETKHPAFNTLSLRINNPNMEMGTLSLVHVDLLAFKIYANLSQTCHDYNKHAYLRSSMFIETSKISSE